MADVLGPDELSELAEAIDAACQAWIAEGGTIGLTPSGGAYQRTSFKCRCPLGALLGGRQWPSEAYWQSRPSALKGLPIKQAKEFYIGFEGWREFYSGTDAELLGRFFRERYIENGGAP